MMRHLGMRLLLVSGLMALVVVVASAQSSGSQPPQTDKPPRQKKVRKVWTNDDFASGSISLPAKEEPKPEASETKKPAAAEPPAKDNAELEAARKERNGWQSALESHQRDLERSREQRKNAADDTEWDLYDQSIRASEAKIAEAEEELKQLDARIAELEKQAKSRPRRTRKPAPPRS